MNMLEFISSLTFSHAALFVAMLALLASIRSNVISEKARRFTEKAHNNNEKNLFYEKRTKILEEIDSKYALFGRLLAVTAKKIILFREHPELMDRHPTELERLSKNLEHIEKIRTSYESERELMEQGNESLGLEHQEKLLAEIRKLTIPLKEEVLKEEQHYSELRDMVKK